MNCGTITQFKKKKCKNSKKDRSDLFNNDLQPFLCPLEFSNVKFSRICTAFICLVTMRNDNKVKSNSIEDLMLHNIFYLYS